MKEPYLEVTFRQGRSLAAYVYLSRHIGRKSHSSRRVEPGMIIDFDRSGQALGIEITAPSAITLAALNRVLRELGEAGLKRTDVAPLVAA